MDKLADKEELLRVLDKNGKLTSKFVQRSLAHKTGIYHQEVAFIPVKVDGGGEFKTTPTKA